MRLLELNSSDKLSLTKDYVNNIPPYAILSHTWGEEEDEVTFDDFKEGIGLSKVGYRKIEFCREQAAKDGLRYIWVDTCCINKSNFTELSEAITSMFRWYRNAAKCYVYLSDVSTDTYDLVDQSWQSSFRESRWFTRGWTLQELIAPPSVEFFSSNRKRLGDKRSLEQDIHDITKIAILALQGGTLSTFSIEERMSWAVNRQTKREEDKAYSLLGIFDVHMPLIYGEGTKHAFGRLREEVEKRSKKHQLDGLSAAIQDSSKLAKRSKISHDSDPNSLDPEASSYTENTPNTDNPPELQENLTPRGSHSIDVNTNQSLIDQLYFTKIDERLTSLTAAQGTTCRWFLKKSDYISWQDAEQQPDHGGFLWIKGNPGTGKSTLMKFLFEKAKIDARSNSLHITLSFFFLARGVVEEKSTTGLYRALLHQLFEKAVDLKNSSMEWMTADGARGIGRSGWHESALKQTLIHAIQNLGNRMLTIFIDALDECDQIQALDMICFLEELCDCAGEAQVRLQICFSSRHYPTIAIQKGIQISLEDEIGHTEDMKQYIKSKLRLGTSSQAESLRSEILEKSSSIFLWVVLVLDILNSEYPNTSISIKRIRQRLKEIPPKLHDLFEMILTRDGKNLDQLEICLKWILFAMRPLKPQELYFAVSLGLDKGCSSTWDQEDVRLDEMKSFVRSSSKGLAEVTRTKTCEVQFIHESVRDFLLGEYRGQWSKASSNFVGHSHRILRDCCLAQLKASISQVIDIPDPLPQASGAAQLREDISLKFPFLEYSILNVLCHANISEQNAVEQGDFLTHFPLQQWIFLNNALERYDIRRYTASASLLYILAEKNLANLIQIHPKKASCFDIENERYGLPMFAALATRSDEAVQTFLKVQAESLPPMSHLHSLWNHYCNVSYKSKNFVRNFNFSKRKGIASYMVELGEEVILAFYLKQSTEMEFRDKHGSPLLAWAARDGHETIFRLLLEKGANFELKDNQSNTPLLLAARYGREAMVKVLLEKGADLESKDYDRKTPLWVAARIGREAIAKLLLEKGADLEPVAGSGQTPLLVAANSGNWAIAELLLEKGADLEAKDYDGKTPLITAIWGGKTATAKLFLEKGADLESKDYHSQTPLLMAARNGHEAIAKLLLEKGADLEAKNHLGQTSLFLAAENEHTASVKLLLEKGADVEAKDSTGRKPLSFTVVKLMLENVANANVENKIGQTIL